MFSLSIKDLDVILNNDIKQLNEAGFEVSQNVIQQHPKAEEILFEIKHQEKTFSFVYIRNYEETEKNKDNILKRTMVNFNYNEKNKDIIFSVPEEELTYEERVNRQYSNMLENKDFNIEDHNLFYTLISNEDFLKAYKNHKDFKSGKMTIRDYHFSLMKIGLKYKFNADYLKSHFYCDCKGVKPTLGYVQLHLKKLKEQYNIFETFSYLGESVNILNNNEIIYNGVKYSNLDIVIGKIDEMKGR